MTGFGHRTALLVGLLFVVACTRTVEPPQALAFSSVETAQWVLQSCDGPIVQHTLQSADDGTQTLVHKHAAPHPTNPEDCALSWSEVSPDGTHLLIPLEAPSDNQGPWAVLAVDGDVVVAELGANFIEPLWSPDQSALLAIGAKPPRSQNDPDDDSGESPTNPGVDFVVLDLASGTTTPGIPAELDINTLLSWEPDGRIIGRQSGSFAAKPLITRIGDSISTEMSPPDHFRLNQVTADDWYSIANGWNDIAFNESSPICRAQADLDPVEIVWPEPTPPNSCIVKVHGVVGDQFLVSLNRVRLDMPVGGNELHVLVEPLTGEWTEFASSTDEEWVYVVHVGSSNAVVVGKSDRQTDQRKLVVLDSSGSEVLVLSDSLQNNPVRVVGLLQP